MKHEKIAIPAEAAAPRLVAERKPLLAALNLICRRIVERRNTIPILANVALGVADDGGLVLYATDLDLAVLIDVPAVWDAPAAFTAPAAELRDAVKKLPGDSVNLALDGAAVIVTAGRARFAVKALPIEDMPDSGAPRGDLAAFAMPGDLLARDLAALAPHMSKDDNRPWLNGVALECAGGVMEMTATESANMATVARPAPAGLTSLPPAIIPARAVSALSALLAKADETPVRAEIGARSGSRGRRAETDRISFAGAGWRLWTRLVDGAYPQWRRPFDELGEMQAVAFPELEPRLSAKALERFAKALPAGAAMSIAAGHRAALITVPGYPEFRGLSTFATGAAYGNYSYGYDSDAGGRAAEYLRGLVAAYGLPPREEDGRLICEHGRAVGMTFGDGAWQDDEWAEEPCYETFTMKKVRVRAEGLVYPSGAYSVFLPRNDRPVVAELTVTVDDVTMPVLHVPGGAIALSKETVSKLVGDISDAPRVEIAPLQFHHGEIVTGLVFPPAPMIRAGDGKRARMRKMTDREALDAYCADPEGFMAGIRPRAANAMPDPAQDGVEAPAAAEIIAGLAMAIAAMPVPSKAEGPDVEPTNVIAVDFVAAAVQRAAAEAVEARAIENAPDDVAALAARLAAVEAALEAMTAAKVAEPEAEKRSAPPAPPAPRAQNVSGMSRARRERLIRRYLAMRAARDAARERAAAEERRAEAAEFDKIDLAARLAAETARANDAEAVHLPEIDRLKGQVVELQDKLLEKLSNGRIRMSPPRGAPPAITYAAGRLN